MTQIEGLARLYKRYVKFENCIAVEAGGYDGTTHSNIEMLANIGIECIFIEPVIEYALICGKHYERFPEVKVKVSALSDRKETVIGYKSGEHSTMNQEDANIEQQIPYFEKPNYEEVLFETERLDNLVTINPEQYFILSLDVEGIESEILKTLKRLPDFAIIELHEDSPEWIKHDKVRFNITEVYKIFEGYKVIYKDDINTIFVKENI